MKGRKWWLLGAVLLAVALLAGGLWWRHSSGRDSGYALRQLRLGNARFKVQIADTKAKQELGLGERRSLPDGRGMLFIYDKPQQLCFWMKDMHFPIDMVWLDQNRKIVRIQSRIAPETYPTAYCVDSSQYVLEIGAGQADARHLQQGQQAQF